MREKIEKLNLLTQNDQKIEKQKSKKIEFQVDGTMDDKIEIYRQYTAYNDSYLKTIYFNFETLTQLCNEHAGLYYWLED